MTAIPMAWYIWVALAMFGIGAVGLLTRRNAIVLFMSIEIMLNAANLLFLTFARYQGSSLGHAAAFMVIAIAAAEAAVGLAIILAVFRHRASVDVDDARSLRG